VYLIDASGQPVLAYLGGEGISVAASHGQTHQAMIASEIGHTQLFGEKTVRILKPATSSISSGSSSSFREKSILKLKPKPATGSVASMSSAVPCVPIFQETQKIARRAATSSVLSLHPSVSRDLGSSSVNSVQQNFEKLTRQDYQGKPKFRCMFCGKYVPEVALAVHECTKSFLAGKTLKCDYEHCDKRFLSRGQLLRHKHEHYYGFKCICKLTFRTYKAYIEHNRIHRRVEATKCQYCEKSFRKKTVLVKHERAHRAKTELQCNYCAKKFVNNARLVDHERIHNAEKTVKCRYCERLFPHEAPCACHERSHERNMNSKNDKEGMNTFPDESDGIQVSDPLLAKPEDPSLQPVLLPIHIVDPVYSGVVGMEQSIALTVSI
jgi:uncharacterized Zn-finger protein